jgi:divalent metal cation (Fe/Co/Zn/Cd) transporter
MISAILLLIFTAIIALVTAAIVGWPITLGVIGFIIGLKIFKKVRG